MYRLNISQIWASRAQPSHTTSPPSLWLLSAECKWLWNWIYAQIRVMSNKHSRLWRWILSCNTSCMLQSTWFWITPSQTSMNSPQEVNLKPFFRGRIVRHKCTAVRAIRYDDLWSGWYVICSTLMKKAEDKLIGQSWSSDSKSHDLTWSIKIYKSLELPI